jgi:RNA polymerase sigma-70 factor (ECF subfamily)
MAPSDGDQSAYALAEATARSSYSRLVAYLAAHTRDIAAAEDALSEAFAAALSDWPKNGCPDKPEAWLLTVARRRSIDLARRQKRGEAVSRELRILADLETTAENEIPDRRLELMFACAHPAIDAGMRAPLMLQLILGLNAATIASCFLVPPSTMGQRLVRAKNKLQQAGVPFRIPEQHELQSRLGAVLDAIYACYAEGWSDPGGTDVARRDLAQEAIFLGSLVCELMPDEAEALGLLALMLHAEARRGARRTAGGAFVPLKSQDRSLWDSRMIRQAEALLERAGRKASIGRYQIEAALQSAHVHRHLSGEANWPAVIQLYDALYALTRSPVVAMNRALAIAEIEGASAALEVLGNIESTRQLSEYQPYWAVRADLLARAGDSEQARHAYDVAIGLERDTSVRRFLQERKAALVD